MGWHMLDSQKLYTTWHSNKEWYEVHKSYILNDSYQLMLFQKILGTAT